MRDVRRQTCIELMVDAKLKPIAVDGVSGRDTEVIGVSYDARVLRVTVEFYRSPKREWVYVDFRFPRGFRMLHEGDLLEFWRGEHTQSFLFEVEKGGWLDLEAQREGFISSRVANPTEYLVCGVTDCVSVLAIERPQFTVCA
jgi:hypothetical protein